MKFFKNFLQNLGQIIFPNHCLSCHKIIAENGFFCEKCWPKLQFICEPKCQICSYPFEFEGLNLICSKCLQQKPAFDKALALFRYNYVIRKIISSLKYNDQTFLGKKFAEILFTKFKAEIKNCDLIIAVPLHKKRLKKRQFNQAILLAKNIAKLAKKQFYPDFIIKNKPTTPQIKLRKKERENNLKRAFAINEKYFTLLKNKHILLIDDVITTGATLQNCAKILKKSGAKKVTILTIARTAL